MMDSDALHSSQMQIIELSLLMSCMTMKAQSPMKLEFAIALLDKCVSLSVSANPGLMQALLARDGRRYG